MYADDTTVFCIGLTQDVACNLPNCALEELFTWGQLLEAWLALTVG